MPYRFQEHRTHWATPPALPLEMWRNATHLISELEGTTLGQRYRIRTLTVQPRGERDYLFIEYIVERVDVDTWIFHTVLYPEYEGCPMQFIDLVDHDVYNE